MHFCAITRIDRFIIALNFHLVAATEHAFHTYCNWCILHRHRRWKPQNYCQQDINQRQHLDFTTKRNLFIFTFTTCAQSISFISGLSPRNDFVQSIRVTKSNKTPSTDSTNLRVGSGFLSSLSLNSKKSAFARNGYFDKTDNLAFDLPY